VIPSDLSPLWISLRTSAAATAAAFVLGIAAAYAMSRYRGRGRGLIDGLFLLPLVLPPTVVGFFLLLLFGRRSVIGHALETLGLTIAAHNRILVAGHRDHRHGHCVSLDVPDHSGRV
jgi:ABC-type molybdate transport system permease subunit